MDYGAFMRPLMQSHASVPLSPLFNFRCIASASVRFLVESCLLGGGVDATPAEAAEQYWERRRQRSRPSGCGEKEATGRPGRRDASARSRSDRRRGRSRCDRLLRNNEHRIVEKEKTLKAV